MRGIKKAAGRVRTSGGRLGRPVHRVLSTDPKLPSVRLTDHFSGPVLANWLKRRPGKRREQASGPSQSPSLEDLPRLPFSGRGLPRPVSRRAAGSSYLPFSTLPRAPRSLSNISFSATNSAVGRTIRLLGPVRPVPKVCHRHRALFAKKSLRIFKTRCHFSASARHPNFLSRSYVGQAPRRRSAVYFLWHFPSGETSTPAFPLGSALPCGARTFLRDPFRRGGPPTPPIYFLARSNAWLANASARRLCS